MLRTVVAAALGLALLGPAPACAQEDEGPTYQDSTGLTWSVATLELGLMAAVAAAAAVGEQDGGAVGAVALGAAVVASAVAAGVGQATGAPVEPPMVFHQGLVGAALLGGLLSFSLRAAGERGDAPAILGVAGLLAGAAGAATYSVLRMDRLAHDPELVEEAHVLSWAPILTAGILTGVLGAVGLTDEAGLVGAIAGLAVLGGAIALVEVAVAENPPPGERMPTTAPLLGYAGTF
jgi:hypothetical protein